MTFLLASVSSVDTRRSVPLLVTRIFARLERPEVRACLEGRALKSREVMRAMHRREGAGTEHS